MWKMSTLAVVAERKRFQFGHGQVEHGCEFLREEGGCHCLTSTVLSVWHPSPVYDNANANVKALTLAKECIWEGTFELPTHVSLCLEETPQTRVFVWTC